MPVVTYQDALKQQNAQLRVGTAFEQVQLAAKLNETSQILTWEGANPALWDYPTGTVVISASSSNARSTVVDFGKEFFHKGALVRLVSTVGATPTATVSIQGSKDNSTWSNVNYADYLSPGTVVATNLTITTATTNIKVVQPGQNFRFLSVLVAADTNVTLTVDISFLG